MVFCEMLKFGVSFNMYIIYECRIELYNTFYSVNITVFEYKRSLKQAQIEDYR